MLLRRLTSSTSCVLFGHAGKWATAPAGVGNIEVATGTRPVPSVLPDPWAVGHHTVAAARHDRKSCSPTGPGRTFRTRRSEAISGTGRCGRTRRGRGWRRRRGRRRCRAAAISSAMFERLHRTAVLDAHGGGGRVVGQLGDAGPDRRAHRLGVVGGGRAAGADGPDRLVGDDHRRRPARLAQPGEAGARPGRAPWPRCSPASRSSSVSPTHMIGVIAVARIAFTLRLTISSVSPKSSRRSLWPHDHVAHVELGQQRRRHLAGERALVLPVAVLGAERRTAMSSASMTRLHAAQVGERRVDAHVDVVACVLRQQVGRASARSGSPRSGCGASSSCRVISGRRGVSHRRRAPLAARRGPGRSPSSSSSSEAPPPVETWSTSSSRPNSASAARRVAAADDGERLGVGDGLGDGAGAGGEAVVLEHAHRAVPEHGAGLHHDVAELGRRARADVEALGAVGQRGCRTSRTVAAGAEADDVGRQVDRLGRLGEQLAARVDLVGLEQRVADGWPWAARNVKHIPPPMASASTVVEQGLDHAELVADLGPAEHGDERPRRARCACRSSTSTSRCEQAAQRRRHVARRADDRGVGAVRRAEGVVDVGVDARRRARRRRRRRWPPRRGRSAGSRAARRRAPARRAGRAPASIEYLGSGLPLAGRGGWR